MSNTSSLLFLVPAHNEKLLITACVESLLRMDFPRDRVHVIVLADNCSDETADLARAAGAEAWSREDLVNRGKSAAIGWAVAKLDLSRWDAVVILDADSTVDPGFARALAAHAPLKDKVVQAYFGPSNEFESWLTRLSGVLSRIRYEIDYPSKQAANLNVPLTGNGMCIGVDLLAGGWKADSITENWELYARWTVAGVRIGYARDALLFSQEAGSLKQGGTQRLRWASGRSEAFRKWFRPVLDSTAIRGRQKLDTLWTLGAPSPVVGGMLAVVVAALGLLLLPSPWSFTVAGIAGLALLPLVSAIVRVLIHHPQKLQTLVSFVMLPPYAIWRAILQVRSVLVGTRQGWVRTARQ